MGVGEPKLITCPTMSPASNETAVSGSVSRSLCRRRSFRTSPRTGAPGFSATFSTASCGPLVNR